MFLVRRRALFSDPVNMNKLALFCVALLNFSFLGYYIRDPQQKRTRFLLDGRRAFSRMTE